MKNIKNIKKKEVKQYNGWLNHPNFIKRSIGIAIYNIFGQILILSLIVIIMTIITIIIVSFQSI